MLFQKLCDDLRRKRREPTFVMGARYYRTLKDQYRAPTDPLSMLTAPNPPQIVAPSLLKAMIATKKARPDHTLMQAYLGRAAKPNKTELVGILKWGLGLRPSSDKQVGPLMDLCRFIARTDVCKHYPDEFAVMQPAIDATLLAAHNRSKLDKTDSVVFVQLHRQVCELLIPGDALGKVLGCKEKCDHILAELNEVWKHTYE